MNKEISLKKFLICLSVFLFIVMIVLYMTLLLSYGIKNQFLNNLQLIKYVILTPMIVIAFVVDYKHQIIPNRLNLSIFEVGLAASFVAGLYNMNLLTDSLLGMAVGGGVFLIITLIGGLIAGKEAMGALRTLLWSCKYHYYNAYGIFICCYY